MNEADSISFYTGHGTIMIWPPFYQQHWSICTDSGDFVDDMDVHPHTAGRKVRFVFLWSCFQGDLRGGHYGITGDAFGMPHCWLYTESLSEDGYAVPDGNRYAFIGFKGSGPAMYYSGFGYYAGYYFAGNFYRWAAVSGHSIRASLDYATRQTWIGNNSFADSPYRKGFRFPDNESGNMMVYGDGNLVIGYSSVLPSPLPDPPMSGGCPTLFVWDANGYIDYGVIDIHNPTGEDVVREVPVLARIVETSRHRAMFRLREGWPGLKYSQSVIDQVKLYAIRSDGKRHLCPLVNATYSSLGNVLAKLLASDDRKVQMLLFETVDLTFIVPYKNIQSFTFVIEGCNEEKGIT
jgi:hypothetical protein